MREHRFKLYTTTSAMVSNKPPIVDGIIVRMAQLKVLTEQPERIVLGKGGANVIGALIGIGTFGIITCAALGSIFDESGELNPVMILLFLVIGLAILASVLNALSSTRVVLDANQRVATRTRTILLIPAQRQEMAFNLIRDVQVTRPPGAGAFAMDTFPIWQVQLDGTDGTALIVNERGTRAEMDALAQKVGALLNRPVRAENQTNPAPAGTFTATAVVGSLLENLAAFAQSATEPGAPARSFFPDDSPRMKQERLERERASTPFTRASDHLAAEQDAASASAARVNSQMEQERASAFASDVAVQNELGAEQRAADAPFVAASARLTQAQADAETAMGYTMPPMLTMPQMPSLLSFAPAMNLPSFPPLGSALESPATSLTESSEVKQVEAQVASPRAESREARDLFQQARRLYAARNFRDAEATFLRVLSTNPADALAQNDLGVVYFSQNKMQDAERAFRRAVALDPFTIEGRYNLGLVLNRLGRRADAQEQFRVGVQNVGREGSKHFQEALRGVLHEPLLSR